jgi:hypothetical protein
LSSPPSVSTRPTITASASMVISAPKAKKAKTSANPRQQ